MTESEQPIKREDIIALPQEMKDTANALREKAVRQGVDALIEEAQKIPDIEWAKAVSVHVKCKINIF